MTLHPFELDSVNADIRQHHRDALRDLQARSALGARPVTTNVLTSIRASLGEAMAIAGNIVHPAPRGAQDPASCAC
jgi:hypothetical protein